MRSAPNAASGKPAAPIPVATDVVLVGGGHSHVAVLKHFGMRPLPGLRLTLVSRDLLTPYSGMLPGLVAGHYTPEQAHIDLRRLARFADARVVHAPATGIDLRAKRVFAAGRPPIAFDLLSLDVGSQPALDAIEGAREHALGVKPIDVFRARWAAAERDCLRRGGRLRVAVIGAGAGGTELALALRYRLGALLARAGLPEDRAEVTLLSEAPEAVPALALPVRRRLARRLGQRGIRLLAEHRAVAVRADGVVAVSSGGGRATVVCDLAIAATHAAAPDWLGESGLDLDAAGFVRVRPTLQTTGAPFVLAAGDVASFDGRQQALPKSGVHAVRQGPVLALNLARLAAGRAPRRGYRPRSRTLALISTGDRHAVASWGRLALEGAWVWRAKDRIDRRWMRKYQELPAMGGKGSAVPADRHNPEAPAGAPEAPGLAALSHAAAMRCGGCGSKVASAVLRRVLDRLPPSSHPDVVVGFRDGGDDAAVLRLPPGKLLVQSVDHFRAFIDDPWLFGRIAAQHCLSDLFAMGAEPRTAQALATLPFAAPAKVEQDLFDLLSGVTAALAEAGAALAGGHTAEGPECALGLAVNGLADRVLTKGGARPGDCLVLTKALGTGVVFAADMRGEAEAEAVDAALASMLASNAPAARVFREHGAASCTDVTGFGLLGHLVEMLRASGAGADLRLAALPLLPRAAALFARGMRSSLHTANAAFGAALDGLDPADLRAAPLFDPQTSGGLLAAVPAERAEDCVAALAAAGCAPSHVGTVRAAGQAGPARVHVRIHDG